MSKSSVNGASDPAAVLLLPPACADNGVSRTRAQQRISLTTKRRKMSRRANLIGICGVSSLCILLLIATAQHRPAPLTMGSGMGVAVGSSGLASGYSGSERRHAAVGAGGGAAAAGAGAGAGSSDALPLQAIAYNMSASIADVLAAQRARIDTEMENFEYPQGRFGVDAEKLSDMTPVTGGVPVRSVIITTWRSGSTFLGDILNAMPGTYYHYEPLLTLGINRVRDADEGAMALRHLKNLLNCDYTDMAEYLEYAKTHTYLFMHNERLWRVCKDFPHYCYQSKLVTNFCKLFPMQSMKTVRVQLSIAKELLEDKSLNVRLVLLVRDPRGTMQSRKHRDWCAGNPDCDDPSHLCNDLVADYQTAVQLLKEYPSRFRTLRYEDLSLNINDMTQEILQFFGLPFDPLVEEFLDTHTKVNIGGVSSTYRDSRWAPFHWKQDLRPEEIAFIQKHCTEAMKLWGYRKIENFTDYQHTFDPIELPPPLV